MKEFILSFRTEVKTIMRFAMCNGTVSAYEAERIPREGKVNQQEGNGLIQR